MATKISDERVYKHFLQQNVIALARPYFSENMSSLSFCPKCMQPHGKFKLRWHEWAEHRCDCDKHEDPKWSEGMDFNKAYETCYCCGLEVIQTGSRWSTFFCRDCRKAIRKFNDSVGTCVIPLGRHSMMNGIRFKKSAPLPEAASLFSSELKSMGKLMNRAHEHGALILRHQLKILKLPEDASLITFLKASFSIDRKQAKKDALLSIIEYILKNPPKIVVPEPFAPKIESIFTSEPEISCVFYTVVIRNEAINQKYEGGIKAFVAKHGVKYNNDLSLMIFMAPGGVEDTEKMLKQLGFKREEDFTWFEASEMARKKPTVKSIPFKAKWLKGYCSKGRAYVSLVR
jgi:hypothetical protein